MDKVSIEELLAQLNETRIQLFIMLNTIMVPETSAGWDIRRGMRNYNVNVWKKEWLKNYERQETVTNVRRSL